MSLYSSVLLTEQLNNLSMNYLQQSQKTNLHHFRYHIKIGSDNQVKIKSINIVTYLSKKVFHKIFKNKQNFPQLLNNLDKHISQEDLDDNGRLLIQFFQQKWNNKSKEPFLLEKYLSTPGNQTSEEKSEGISNQEHPENPTPSPSLPVPKHEPSLSDQYKIIDRSAPSLGMSDRELDLINRYLFSLLPQSTNKSLSDVKRGSQITINNETIASPVSILFKNSCAYLYLARGQESSYFILGSGTQRNIKKVLEINLSTRKTCFKAKKVLDDHEYQLLKIFKENESGSAPQYLESGLLFCQNRKCKIIEEAFQRDLSQLVTNEKKLPISIIEKMTHQLLKGLSDLHNMTFTKDGFTFSTFNGDIKALNILHSIDHLGRTHIKIIDFGISDPSSRAIRKQLNIQVNTVDIGSPIYMPPEIFYFWMIQHDDSPECSQRSANLDDENATQFRMHFGTGIDVWGMGITLIEMLESTSITNHLKFRQIVAEMINEATKKPLRGPNLNTKEFLTRPEYCCGFISSNIQSKFDKFIEDKIKISNTPSEKKLWSLANKMLQVNPFNRIQASAALMELSQNNKQDTKTSLSSKGPVSIPHKITSSTSPNEADSQGYRPNSFFQPHQPNFGDFSFSGRRYGPSTEVLSKFPFVDQNAFNALNNLNLNSPQ